MKENKITLSYQIKSIKPSELKDGYVEVMLEPVDKIEYNHEVHKNNHSPISVTGIGPGGVPFPPEFQQQISQLLKSAIPPSFQVKKGNDPRNIIHVESEIDFLTRNWKYGDIINVTLEKVKKAEDVEQKKE